MATPTLTSCLVRTEEPWETHFTVVLYRTTCMKYELYSLGPGRGGCRRKDAMGG